jgi:hypothetical protein
MGMNVPTDQDLTKALAVIDEQIAAAPVDEGALGLDIPDIDVNALCPAYRNMRGALEVVVGGIAFIPGWGAKAALGIQFAMKVADAACPVNPGPN